MRRDGYIAFMSVVIITAVLMLLVLVSSFSVFFGRSNITDSEIKNFSQGLAEACVNFAIIKFAEDQGVEDFRAIPVATEECTYRIKSGLIQAQGVYRDSYTNLCVEVEKVGVDFITNTWKELKELTPADFTNPNPTC